MDSCIFCDLLADLRQAHVVAQDQSAVAVLDAHPAAPGHTLVISRPHIESIWDLDERTASALMLTVRSVARLLRDRLNLDGLTMRQNNGAASGQRIAHLHIHMVPRWEGDGHIGWPSERAEPVDNALVLQALLSRTPGRS